jgi:ribose/xylose/arabinose/galactoside ABC-type transport system permease subunit
VSIGHHAIANRLHLPPRLRNVDTHNIGLLAGLAALVIIFSSQNSNFLLLANIINIGQSIAILGLVAVAQTAVMIAGGLDISVGSVAGLASVVAALSIAHAGTGPTGMIIGIIAGALLGLVAGLINGTIVTFTGISAVIVTLGTYTIFEGIGYLISSGVGVPILNQSFNRISTNTVVGVPLPVIVLAVLALICALFLRFTDIGRNVYALGGNAVAARLAGIRVDKYRIAIYATTGLIASVAGLLLAARVGSGQATSGSEDLALSSIAAVLLGGTSLAGGRGTILGTVLGVLVLGTLNNGLLILGVSNYWQLIAQGSVLIAVVVLQVKPWTGAARAARNR